MVAAIVQREQVAIPRITQRKWGIPRIWSIPRIFMSISAQFLEYYAEKCTRSGAFLEYGPFLEFSCPFPHKIRTLGILPEYSRKTANILGMGWHLGDFGMIF